MCDDCNAAAEKLWHGYTKGCPNCDARMVARSPQFVQSRRAGTLTREYQAMLGLTGVTHERAKAAAARDLLCRKSAWMAQ